jgi:hypothetical protein
MARVVGGELKPDPSEVLEMVFFGRSEIPEELLWWNRQRIFDAFEGARGVVWSQVSDYPFEKEIPMWNSINCEMNPGLLGAIFILKPLVK